jgi:hypothetical protein
MMDLNLKLQATSTKSLAKAIDFELRKEHAVEAEEQLNIVKVIIILFPSNCSPIFPSRSNQKDPPSKAFSASNDSPSKHGSYARFW